MKTQPTIKLKDLKCTDCGGQLIYIPDEEVDSIPPTLDSRYFSCDSCSTASWCYPDEWGIEDWYDVEEWSTPESRETQRQIQYYL